MFFSMAQEQPATSAMTEWSMTRSQGICGLIFAGSPPRFAQASRITAKSTNTGTPVKSWNSTRAGLNSTSLPTSPAQTRLDHALSQIGSRLWVLGVTQHVFEQHLQRIGKLLGTLDLLNGIVGISRIAHGQGSGELLVLHIVPSWCVSHPDIDLAEHDSAGDLAHRRKPYRESVSTSSRTRRRNPFGYQAPTFSRARRRKPYWKSAPTSNCTRRLKPTPKIAGNR